MFFPIGDLGSFFAPDNVCCAAMAGYAARAHAMIIFLAVATLFTVALPTLAQPQTATPIESGSITFESEGRWRSWFGSSDVIHYEPVRAPGTGNSWLGLTIPRLAFRDDWYNQPAMSPVLAQAQNAPANGSEDLPLLPPPRNPTPANDAGASPAGTGETGDSGLSFEGPAGGESDAAPAPGGAPSSPAGTGETGDSGLSFEEPVVEEKETEPAAEEKKEEKKEEKPAVPDLAKGILIASNDGDLTFKPGVRIQPRYAYEEGNDNHDFFIRRFRLKGSGSAYDVAKYGVELKIDNDGRFAATPSARVENAWLDFPVIEDYAYLRAGLYDMPFSRDALTSDSKLLFMDRTLIKEELSGVGFADNAIGVMLHGRPDCGHYEYAFGIFDNVVFERFGVGGTRESDELMPAGRFVWSPLDPMPTLDGYADYLQSYLGKGERLELGINAAHLPDAIDGIELLDLSAWGVDLFYNTGPYTFQTEYDQIVEDFAGGGNIVADGWYAQAGYLFNMCDPCVEFAVRYEELNPIIGEQLNWYRIGFNFYIREHNLKIQTDYNIRSHTVGTPLPGGLGLFDENVFEVQLQLDF